MQSEDIAHRAKMASHRQMLAQTTDLAERKIIIEGMAREIKRHFVMAEQSVPSEERLAAHQVSIVNPRQRKRSTT